MLKSILLLLGGALVLGPLALAGHQAQPTPTPAPQQTPQPAPQPAAPQTPQPNPAAPRDTSQTPEATAAPVAAGIPPDTKNPVKPTAAGMARAKELYTIDCAMCHADNGNGKTDLATSMAITPADLTSASTLGAVPDGELFNIIRAGKGKMPGEDPARANDTEVWNLVTYVRSFSNPAAAAIAPESTPNHTPKRHSR